MKCQYCGNPTYGDNFICEDCRTADDFDEDELGDEYYEDDKGDEPYDSIKDPDNYSPEGFKTIEEHNEFWEAFFESQNKDK